MLVNFTRFWIFIYLFSAHISWALSLDQAQIKSYLNENLKVEIAVILNSSDFIENYSFGLASGDRYENFGTDRPKFIDNLEIKIGESPDFEGSMINISSKVPIRKTSFILLIESNLSNQSKLDAIPIKLVPRDVSYGYEIQEGETLWSIAYKNRPGNDLTMNQMMIAIYMKNIGKFENGIDDIQQGLIDIPNRKFIKTIPHDAIFDITKFDLYQKDAEKIHELELSISNVLLEKNPTIDIQNVDLYEEQSLAENLISNNKEVALSSTFTSINQDENNQVIENHLLDILDNQGVDINTDIIQNELPEIIISNDLLNNDYNDDKLTNNRLINNKEALNKSRFNQIIDFMNNFWPLLILSILLLISFTWIIWNSFKKEKNTVMDLEKSIAMNEVATKLDLARAYVDMGDPEGAYEILEEVINHGDKSQKQLAKKLLDALDR